jgi:hypothetical protein
MTFSPRPTFDSTHNAQNDFLLVTSVKATEQYNSLLWLVNQTNNDPNVLPDTRIEIVPVNTFNDQLNSFQKANELLKTQNVAAVIGDSVDEGAFFFFSFTLFP